MAERKLEARSAVRTESSTGSKFACARYVASYGKSSDSFWDRAWMDVTEHIEADAASKAKAIPATEVIFAVACGCRLDPTQTIGAAVDAVVANAERNLTPIIPIGVPRQPKGWARAFDQWIEGHGPRPQWRGRAACVP